MGTRPSLRRPSGSRERGSTKTASLTASPDQRTVPSGSAVRGPEGPLSSCSLGRTRVCGGAAVCPSERVRLLVRRPGWGVGRFLVLPLFSRGSVPHRLPYRGSTRFPARVRLGQYRYAREPGTCAGHAGVAPGPPRVPRRRTAGQGEVTHQLASFNGRPGNRALYRSRKSVLAAKGRQRSGGLAATPAEPGSAPPLRGTGSRSYSPVAPHGGPQRSAATRRSLLGPGDRSRMRPRCPSAGPARQETNSFPRELEKYQGRNSGNPAAYEVGTGRSSGELSGNKSAEDWFAGYARSLPQRQLSNCRWRGPRSRRPGTGCNRNAPRQTGV